MSRHNRKESVFGGSPRPSALVLGFRDEEVLSALRRRFPTLWTEDSFQPGLSCDEVDYVISGGFVESLASNGMKKLIHPYFKQCRLIMLFNAPEWDQDVGFHGGKGSGFLAAETFDLHPILNELMKSELGGISDFSQWIKLFPRSISTNTDPFALLPHAILRNKQKDVLGLVTNPRSPPFKHQKYRACLPWKVIDPVNCIDSIIEYWALTAPEDHPFYIHWSKDPAWMTPEEREAFDEIEMLNKEEEAVISRINAARSKANQRLQEHRVTSEHGIKKLLTTKDAELVGITATLLEKMGLSVQDMDQFTAVGQRVEDLRLSHPDFCGEVLCELKGHESKGGSRKDLDSFRKHIAQYRRENNRDPYRSWFIVNGQFKFPPGKRHAPFQSDKETVVSLEDDEKILVIGTCDLYRLLIDDTITPDERRQRLLAKEGGVFRWPPPK